MFVIVTVHDGSNNHLKNVQLASYSYILTVRSHGTINLCIYKFDTLIAS